ncbi:MAG: beta-ribofuranosylaminobenzene 5'-phosphate synthase family protein [Methylophilaceae bacterium]
MSDSVVKNNNGVAVMTTARLHMGFFDLNGGLGRKFGSIGVSLDHPATQLQAFKSDTFTVEGENGERALKMACQLAKTLNLQGGVHLNIQSIIPEHAGLGSGTQLALAVGLAMNKLYGLSLTIKDIALMTERGARSGIGLGTFAAGGVIVDGGRAEKTEIPPVIARADFPEEWRIILIFDHAKRGVHGAEEVEAFKTLPQFPADEAAMLCRSVLMQALPALAEQDLAAFGAAIKQLQERTGDHFAPAQGGRYASRSVAEVIEWLGHQGVTCLGQSSWGPTGFAVYPTEQAASSALIKLNDIFGEKKNLTFALCKGRNQGGLVYDL